MQTEEEFTDQTKPVAEESEVKAPEISSSSEINETKLFNFLGRVQKACEKDKTLPGDINTVISGWMEELKPAEPTHPEDSEEKKDQKPE